MREIKFRIWNPELDNGRMLYFDNFEEIVDWQNWDEWKLENSPMRSVDYMQYTGLKDKNGKEIYEGDIALYEPFETHNNDRVIVYENGAFYGKLIRNGYGELLGKLDGLNVIGNVHENPELLKGERI